ncbi:hypothetical protein LJC24_00505 [Desulfococcaceae bacterium OttesenSCG-928-F15]|nr:hypothetical protein [Desulfococcaceae bacterium OttesenSCG-928-F15]
MKQYLIDTLNFNDHAVLKKHLDRVLERAVLDGLYWLELPEALLSEEQRNHAGCAPHVVALELGENSLSCEFLVRTKKAMRCSCMAYATDEQILWIIRFLDQLLEENAIIA